MSIAVTVLSAPTAATLLGIAGLAAQLTWPLLQKRDAILLTQLGAASSYAASYALMGRETASALCLVGAIQTTVALLAGDRLWLSRAGYLFLPVVLAIGFATYAGLPTILAITACCLTMVARQQPDTLRMRGLMLGASPFGAAHDIAVGAWPCLAGAVVSFTISLAAFLRELRVHSPSQQPA